MPFNLDCPSSLDVSVVSKSHRFLSQLSELPGAAGKLPAGQKAASGPQAVAAGGSEDDDLQARYVR